MYLYKDINFRTTTFFYFLWDIAKETTGFLAKREIMVY